MLNKRCTLICISLTLVAACAPVIPTATVTPSLVPSPTSTPPATATPTPTPTATPIPTLALTIRWPDRVSPLEPAPIAVELLPPPGVSVTATLNAAVVDPKGALYRLFELTPQEDHLYAAEEPLQLPLEPLEGDWRLRVHVQSTLEVEGERKLIFRPDPIPFHDLTDVLPAGAVADIRLPQVFVEETASGDQMAGGRVWRYGGGELALWWAPGPSEPLLLNNALVMLETTHDQSTPARVLDVEEEVEWQGQTAFLFYEDWPGAEGGPAEALVAQRSDYWLYVLRIRATGGETIPSLLRQVWGTFAFAAD